MRFDGARARDTALFGRGGGRRRREPAQADLTPLVNVVFLLLIFFLLAGTLAQRSPLSPVLPLSAADYGRYSPDIDIVADADGNIALRDALLTDHNALRQALALARRGGKNGKAPSRVNIRADGALPASKTLSIMQAAKDAGFTEVYLVADASGA